VVGCLCPIICYHRINVGFCRWCRCRLKDRSFCSWGKDLVSARSLWAGGSGGNIEDVIHEDCSAYVSGRYLIIRRGA
jgi:hypothetical protein